MKYYLLSDDENGLKLAKDDGESEYEYVKGEGFVESGILLDYMWPDAPAFGQYKEISEAEAKEFIKRM